MPSPLIAAIRDRLDRYVSGQDSPETFGDWFVPATWHVDTTGDQPLIDLTNEIILRLAEYSNGDCTEVELKGLLRPLVALPAPAAVPA